MTATDTTLPPASRSASSTAFGMLLAIALCHLTNDMVQSLLPAIYPIVKQTLSLSFAQLGIVTLGYQITASLLQPMIGYYTDRRPVWFALPLGMSATLCGLVMLSFAASFLALLIAAMMVGTGSAIFHPESSRVARSASGGRHGLAQSLFQVGGNSGQALGPLIAAVLLASHGQRNFLYLTPLLLIMIVVMVRIGRWRMGGVPVARASHATVDEAPSSVNVRRALAVLVALVFSKFVYLSSLTNYYTFYLITKFHLTVREAQVALFYFLGAAALGTFIGGPIGDRIGRKQVIWVSIAGVLPFTLLLPYANLFWTRVLTVIIGATIASAFSAIVVYAQELLPNRVGMVSGLFFGLAFGMAGLGAAVLGAVADREGIFFVYRICSFLPAIGFLTVFLPDTKRAT